MATAATREQPQVLSLEDSFDHEAPQQDLHGGFMSPDSYEDLMWQGMGSDSGDDFRHPTERAAELIQQLVAAADATSHLTALVQLLQPQLLDEDICGCQEWLQLCGQLPACWAATPAAPATTTTGGGSSSSGRGDRTQPVITTWSPGVTSTPSTAPGTSSGAVSTEPAAAAATAAVGVEETAAAAAAAAAAGRLPTAATCVLWKLSGLLLAPGSICFLGELLLPLLGALMQARLCSCALAGALPTSPTAADEEAGAGSSGGAKRMRPTVPEVQEAVGINSSSSQWDPVQPPQTPAVGAERPALPTAAAAAPGREPDTAAAAAAAVGGMLAFVHLAMDALAQGWHLLEPRQGPALAQLLLQLVQQPLQAAEDENQQQKQQQQACGNPEKEAELPASIAAGRQQLRGLLKQLAAQAAGLDGAGPPEAAALGTVQQAPTAAAAAAGGCERCRCSMTAADVLLQLDPQLPWLQRLASLGGPCGHLAPLLHQALRSGA